MRRVRRGAIIGFGNVAANGHVPGWRLRSDFEIVAVADPDPRRRALAEQLCPGVALYGSHEELLARESLDFVDVASPPAWHTDAVIAAAAKGCHILCEKPLTTSLTDFASMRQAATAARVALVSVHNWKSSEAYRSIQSAIDAGRIGKVEKVRFDTWRDGCSASTGENWRIDAAVAGGGILVDHGWHAFYLMMGLAAEEPQRIGARLENRRFVDAAVEDTVDCTIEFPTVRGEIMLTWAASGRRTRWQVIGTRGQIEVEDDRLTIESPDGVVRQQLASGLTASSHHPDWFSAVVDDFRIEIETPAVRGRSLAEAEMCLRLLTQAYASARRGSLALDLREEAAA